MAKTVASTSNNQVAAGIKKAFKYIDALHAGARTLDYGGGRFDSGIRYLAERGIECRIYDPYARSEVENQDAIAWALTHDELPDVVFLCNVLCVVNDVEERKRVLENAWRYVRPGGFLVVTNYEGDKSCVVRGFQNNRPHHLYVDEFRVLNHILWVHRKDKVYFIEKRK